jgi:hypothetical protein
MLTRPRTETALEDPRKGKYHHLARSGFWELICGDFYLLAHRIAFESPVGEGQLESLVQTLRHLKLLEVRISQPLQVPHSAILC